MTDRKLLLTQAERDAIVDALPGGPSGFFTTWGTDHLAEAMEAAILTKLAPEHVLALQAKIADLERKRAATAEGLARLFKDSTFETTP